MASDKRDKRDKKQPPAAKAAPDKPSSSAAMKKALRMLRWGLPLVMGGGYAAVFVTIGKSTYAAVFAGLVAASAGFLLALLFGAIALLVGQVEGAPPPPDERLDDLERDKRMLLRSIREIELDVQLGKLESAEAEELTEPLRRRAVQVLREIDEARMLDQPRDDAKLSPAERTEREIEAEIRRRVAMFGG